MTIDSLATVHTAQRLRQKLGLVPTTQPQARANPHQRPAVDRGRLCRDRGQAFGIFDYAPLFFFSFDFYDLEGFGGTASKVKYNFIANNSPKKGLSNRTTFVNNAVR